MVYIPIGVVLVATVAAAVTDIWKYRIHNALTIPLIVTGIIFHTWLGGWLGLANSLGGFAFGFGILMIFFAMGGMGAGDVKLMAGVGAWLGLYLTAWVFVFTALVNGIYALYLMIAYRQSRETWVRLKMIWFRFAALGRQLGGEDSIEEAVKSEDRRRKVIPFAAMMAIGLVLLVLVLGYLATMNGSWI